MVYYTNSDPQHFFSPSMSLITNGKKWHPPDFHIISSEWLCMNGLGLWRTVTPRRACACGDALGLQSSSCLCRARTCRPYPWVHGHHAWGESSSMLHQMVNISWSHVGTKIQICIENFYFWLFTSRMIDCRAYGYLLRSCNK